MSYFIIASDGKEYGPYTVEQLQSYISEGRINLMTQARPADGADFRPIGQFPEFSPAGSRPGASLPPAAGYGVPGGGGYGASAGTFPWENRQALGFMPALTDSVRLLALNPKDAFAQIQEKGDYASPLLFGLIVSWAGFVASSIWQMLFGQSWQAFLPAHMKSQMGGMAASAGMTIGMMIIYPVLYIIGIFIGTALLHVCFMIVGGLSNSSSGFEGTLRAASYSYVAQLANVVPFLGGFIAAIWGLILMVIGAQAMHKCSQGKAIAAVLIPVVVCCVCVIGILAMGAAAFMGSMR